MSSQTEEPLVPGHVAFNDAPTLLDAESDLTDSHSSSTQSQSQSSQPANAQSAIAGSQLPTQNKGAKVAEVNIGNERRNSVVREVEVGGDDDAGEGSVGSKGGSGGGSGGTSAGEGQKAMREGRDVI